MNGKHGGARVTHDKEAIAAWIERHVQGVRSKEIADHLKLTTRGCHHLLTKMKADGMIVRIGGGPLSRWATELTAPEASRVVALSGKESNARRRARNAVAKVHRGSRDDPVIQRVISANGAPPPRTNAVRWVFDLAYMGAA